MIIISWNEQFDKQKIISRGNIYSAFHKTFDKLFPKFATKLAISLRSCQNFHSEFRWEVAKFALFGVASLII